VSARKTVGAMRLVRTDLCTAEDKAFGPQMAPIHGDEDDVRSDQARIRVWASRDDERDRGLSDKKESGNRSSRPPSILGLAVAIFAAHGVAP
jgi:hypothetical protein